MALYNRFAECVADGDKPIPALQFRGVDEADLLALERVFETEIVVVSLRADGHSTLEWRSGAKSSDRGVDVTPRRLAAGKCF